MKRRIPGLVFSVVSGLTLAACGSLSEPPYVYNDVEFNREHPQFGTGITDRTSVTVCYNKYAATPKRVAELARDECRRFGKTAVFRNQTLRTCPMMTPVAAVYDCLPDSEASERSAAR